MSREFLIHNGKLTSDLDADGNLIKNLPGVAHLVDGKVPSDELPSDDTVTRTSTNGVKSSGIWSALWGALSSLPTGFTSLYDWCVAQLAGKASTADATLTERGFSEWGILNAPLTQAQKDSFYSEDSQAAANEYAVTIDGTRLYVGNYHAADLNLSDDELSLTFRIGSVEAGSVWGPEGATVATRTALSGYQLGSQSGKPLASEAEAEALRAGKQDALTAQQLANIAAVPNKLDKSGGTVNGDMTVSGSLEVTDDFLSKICIFNIGGEPIVGGRFVVPGAMNKHYATFAFKDAKFGLFTRNGPTDAGTFYALQGISGTLALTAGPNHTGNLAALDASGNSTDSTIPAASVAVKGNIPYNLGTPITIDTASSETVEGETVNYGAATLANRTANVVQVTAATALDELRITFPAATSGKVRDFGLRVEIGTGSAALAAPALVPVAPTGETIKIENNAAEIPALADGTATAKGVTLLYFSETASGVFVVKGEQVEEVL